MDREGGLPLLTGQWHTAECGLDGRFGSRLLHGDDRLGSRSQNDG